MTLHRTRLFDLPRWIPLLALLFMTGAASAQVNHYTFSQPTNSAGYVPITGTNLAVATANSGAASLRNSSFAITLPFSFNFGGSSFTTANVSTNGALTFGTNASTAANAIANNTTGGGVIAAFNGSLRGIFSTTARTDASSNVLRFVADTGHIAIGQTITGAGIPSGTTITAIGVDTLVMSANATITSTGSVPVIVRSGRIDTTTIGTAPNRTFIVQWTGFQIFGEDNSSTEFQVHLAEAGGVATAQTVSIVYGKFHNLSTSSSVQVGLRSNAGNSNFNNREGTTSWTSTVAGNANTDEVAFTSTVQPSTGLLFLYTPPDCTGTPTPGTASASLSAVCAGGQTVLSLTGTTTNTGIAYQWMTSTDNINFTSINGATSDTYTATPVGANVYYKAVVTCNNANPASSNTVNVTVNSLPIVKLGNDTTICPGATITLDAGNPGSTYFYSNSANSQTTAITGAGTYTVAVTDADNCVGHDTIVVSQGVVPVVNLGNDTILCPGTTLVLDAGNAGSTYLFSNAATTQTASITAAGLYSVAVTNTDKCIGTDTIDITAGVSPIVNLGSDTSLCPGDTITLDAGNPGLTYLFNNSATTQTVAITSGGTYSVQVFNSLGCAGVDTLVVNQNAKPVVNLGNDTVICPGAVIVLDAGNAGSSYNFSNSATTQKISVTAAGTYAVEVINPSNCSSRDTITITQGVTPVVNLGNDTTICNGDFLLLDAGNPGSTYLFSNLATTQTTQIRTPAPVNVAVTNADRCVGYDTIIVNVVANPIVKLGNDTTVCPGATIVLDAGNTGSSFLYSNAATTQTTSINAGGTYSAEVTSTFGCVGRDTIVIAQGVNPIVALGNDTVICPAATITLNAGNAGSSYLFSNAATTQTTNINSAGTYSVIVTNPGKCVGFDTIVVASGTNPVVALGNDTTLCPNATITLNAGNAGSSYLFSNSATTQTSNITAAGTYSVIVTSAQKCLGYDTIVITSVTNPVVSLGNDTVICPAATITLDAGNAGSSYLFTGGATTQTLAVTTSGTYSVRVTDANKCIGRDTIIIAAGVNPIVKLGNDTLVCPGDTVRLNAANAGSTYLYSNGATTQITPITTGGTYSVRVTNVNKCVGRDTIVISTGVNPIPRLGNDTVICPAATITLNGGNFGSGFAYLYSNSATTQTTNVTAAGTYTLRVTNTTTGCRGRDTVVITAGVNPIVKLGNDTVVCPDMTITLDAGNPGSSYLYNTGATSQTLGVTTSGTYSVRVTNANKCVGRDTIVIAQGINPIVNLGRDTSVCSGLAITLDAGNPGSTYLYNTGANTRTLSVLPAGLYTVAVTNAQKCIGRDTIDISVIPTAAVNFITQSKTGTTVSFGSDAMSAASYAWSFGDGVTDNVQAPAHNYTNNGVYTVRLIVSNQCGSDTATTTVTISGLGTGTVSLSNDELSLYPNPATAIITLNNKSVLKMKSVTVLNSLGSVVMQKDGVSPNQETLDLGALPAGTYMVRIQTDGGTFLRRLQLVK